MLLATTLLASMIPAVNGGLLVTLFWVGLSVIVLGAASLGEATKTRSWLKLTTVAMLILSLAAHGIMNGVTAISYAALPVSTGVLLASMAIGLLVVTFRDAPSETIVQH